MTPYFRKVRGGFTMVEFILAVGISAIIILAAASFVDILSLFQGLVTQDLAVEQDLEDAITRMTTELRSMAPSAAGAYALEVAEADNLIFFTDIDGDDITERVRYTVTSSTLERGVVEPTGSPLTYVTSTELVSVAVPNVDATSSAFAYFGAFTTQIDDPLAFPVNIPDVRMVRARVTADVSAETAPRAATYQTTVTIRNLRSE